MNARVEQIKLELSRLENELENIQCDCPHEHAMLISTKVMYCPSCDRRYSV